MSECYMVLLSSEDYVVGVLTLAHSLRLVDATRPLVCLSDSDDAVHHSDTSRDRNAYSEHVSRR